MCEGGIEKSIPRITDWHHEACRLMTKGDHDGRIFLSHPHRNNGLFFLPPPPPPPPPPHEVLYFMLENYEKGFPKILNSLRSDMEIILSLYDVTERPAADV